MDAAGRSQRGDVLVDVGDKVIHFFVVVSGEIHVVQPSPGTRDADRSFFARDSSRAKAP